MDDGTIRDIFNAGGLVVKVEEHERRIGCMEVDSKAMKEAIVDIKIGQKGTDDKLCTIIEKLTETNEKMKENSSNKLSWKIAVFTSLVAVGGTAIVYIIANAMK